MKTRKIKYLLCTIALAILSASCTTSRVRSIKSGDEVLVEKMDDGSSLHVFLLERDIPLDIERLGMVSITPNIGMATDRSKIHAKVKKKLREACQELGANGAYRINDGSYQPNEVSYLVFRYEKEK